MAIGTYTHLAPGKELASDVGQGAVLPTDFACRYHFGTNLVLGSVMSTGDHMGGDEGRGTNASCHENLLQLQRSLVNA
jgi:hypothetical protein